MLNAFLAVYEKGYAAGLRRATAMPGERNAFQEAVVLQTPTLGQSTHDKQHDALELLAAQQEALITLWLAQVSAGARTTPEGGYSDR